MSGLQRSSWPLAAAALVFVGSPLSGQTAREIFDEALLRYQAQTDGIAAYTLVQDVMGMATETRFERREIDGVRVFVPVGVPGVDGESSSPLTAFPQFAEVATLEGTHPLEDGACHVLSLEDLSGVDMGFARLPQDEMQFSPRSATFCIDTETYMMRRVTVEGDLTAAGGTGPATMHIASDDYRDVEGLLVPYRTTVEIHGMGPAMGGGDAAAMREAVESARAEIEKMPAAQREAMEQMLEQQLQALGAAAAGGPQTMTMTVTDVRVEKD
jgi:hypothetical protein